MKRKADAPVDLQPLTDVLNHSLLELNSSLSLLGSLQNDLCNSPTSPPTQAIQNIASTWTSTTAVYQQLLQSLAHTLNQIPGQRLHLTQTLLLSEAVNTAQHATATAAQHFHDILEDETAPRAKRARTGTASKAEYVDFTAAVDAKVAAKRARREARANRKRKRDDLEEWAQASTSSEDTRADGRPTKRERRETDEVTSSEKRRRSHEADDTGKTKKRRL